MDDDLLQFHLICSVMRNMKGSGQPEEYHWSEYDEVIEEIAQMLYDCIDLTPETISAGLDLCVLEQFFLDREETCQPAKNKWLFGRINGVLTVLYKAHLKLYSIYITVSIQHRLHFVVQ